MAAKSIEERLDILEAQNKALAHENERLRAARECENVMNQYSYKLLFGPVAECADYFALKTPGVRVTIGPWGSWEGGESVKKCYTKFHTLMTFGDYNGSKRAPGMLMADSNGMPIIEVAKDGKTAKGFWIVVGADTAPTGEGGKLQGYWCWSKRVADFIQEDGQWKIWHYRVYGILHTPYDTDWVDNTADPMHDIPPFIPKELRPDTPVDYWWNYDITKSIEYVPLPPESYKTFDDTFSY